MFSRLFILLVILFMFGCSQSFERERYFKSYLEQRFENVTRQQLDMSCGLAVLSDIFVYRYGENVYEYQLLEKIGLKERYSFSDLKKLSEEYGKKSIPVWMSYDNLLLIKEPAIFYLERKGAKHFVSLSYVDSEHIQIKDPAWGILNYTKSQFENYWLDKDKGKGRVLIFINNSNPAIKKEINQKINRAYLYY